MKKIIGLVIFLLLAFAESSHAFNILKDNYFNISSKTNNFLLNVPFEKFTTWTGYDFLSTLTGLPRLNDSSVFLWYADNMTAITTDMFYGIGTRISNPINTVPNNTVLPLTYNYMVGGTGHFSTPSNSVSFLTLLPAGLLIHPTKSTIISSINVQVDYNGGNPIIKIIPEYINTDAILCDRLQNSGLPLLIRNSSKLTDTMSETLYELYGKLSIISNMYPGVCHYYNNFNSVNVSYEVLSITSNKKYIPSYYLLNNITEAYVHISGASVDEFYNMTMEICVEDYTGTVCDRMDITYYVDTSTADVNNVKKSPLVINTLLGVLIQDAVSTDDTGDFLIDFGDLPKTTHAFFNLLDLDYMDYTTENEFIAIQPNVFVQANNTRLGPIQDPGCASIFESFTVNSYPTPGVLSSFYVAPDIEINMNMNTSALWEMQNSMYTNQSRKCQVLFDAVVLNQSTMLPVSPVTTGAFYVTVQGGKPSVENNHQIYYNDGLVQPVSNTSLVNFAGAVIINDTIVNTTIPAQEINGNFSGTVFDPIVVFNNSQIDPTCVASVGNTTHGVPLFTVVCDATFINNSLITVSYQYTGCNNYYVLEFGLINATLSELPSKTIGENFICKLTYTQAKTNQTINYYFNFWTYQTTIAKRSITQETLIQKRGRLLGVNPYVAMVRSSKINTYNVLNMFPTNDTTIYDPNYDSSLSFVNSGTLNTHNLMSNINNTILMVGYMVADTDINPTTAAGIVSGIQQFYTTSLATAIQPTVAPTVSILNVSSTMPPSSTPTVKQPIPLPILPANSGTNTWMIWGIIAIPVTFILILILCISTLLFFIK